MLPRLPDLGVWRLTTTGFNAAAELPMTVDLLAALTDAGRPIPAVLMIEHRTSKVGGQTRRYVVPTLGFVKSIAELEEVAELEPGTLQRILTAPVRATAAARPVLPTERAALPAEPAPITTPDDSVEPTGRVTAGGSTDVLTPDDSVEPAVVPTTAVMGPSQGPPKPSGSTDVPAAEPPTLAPHDPDGGSAADVRTTIMALQPSEAMVLARLLLTERRATPEAMYAHQLWVRRLFYAMERCGLWRPAGENAGRVDDGGQPMPVDPLHVALFTHHGAVHLADLHRDDLLNFVAQAADAAEAKLGEAADV
jgi:hypothetical protein